MDPKGEEMTPRYPELQVSLRTDNPLAVVSATRLALRRAGMNRDEIETFTQTALASEDPRRTCSTYVRIRREQ